MFLRLLPPMLEQSKTIKISTLALIIGVSGASHAAQQWELVKDINFDNRSGSYQPYTQSMA